MAKEMIPRPLPVKARLHLAHEENASLRTRIAALEAQLAEVRTKLQERADWHKCSCPHPCDDYNVFPGGCAGKYRQDYMSILSALSPAPEAQQEPVAVLEFARNQPGNENEMPRVISCNWLPDGQYKVYTRPAEQAVTDEMVEAACKAFLDTYGDRSAEWYDYRREITAALKAAMEARDE